MDNRFGVDEAGVGDNACLLKARQRELKAGIDALAHQPAKPSLAASVAALKQEARDHGLTGKIVDAELAAWRAERDA